MYEIPYSRQNVTEEDIEAVTAVLRSDNLTQGPMIERFEEAFARRHNVAHAVAVTNATAGLHLGCLALGVGEGSRVWTSPNSFLASANCALYCGADVDFVDIDPATRNMSTEALRRKLASEPRPDVLIPVDFGGLPCDLSEMREIADQYGFRILEDASHATGASYRGAPIGSRYVDAAVFSFHAVKIVTTGEGGIITTQNEQIAARLRLLRSHGMTRDPAQMRRTTEGAWYYEQMLLGYNCRMTDVQAALGHSQLGRLEKMHAARAALAERYDLLLEGLAVARPARRADRVSAWHLYAVELAEAGVRDRAFAALRAARIGVNVHYIPIHLQPFYAGRGFRRGQFPAAEKYYAGALTLPLFPTMTTEQQDTVVATLRNAVSE